MKIAVTGSAGFMGKHVVDTLRDERFRFLEFDRKGGLDLVYLAPNDFEGCDAVIHLAAHADVRNNWDNTDAIFHDNIQALLTTLKTASLSSVRKFIFVSTGAVYADCVGYVKEDMACVATSPYAASKLAGEAYVQAYAEKYGWKWYVVRPSACVGSGYKHGHIADFVHKYRTNGEIFALDDGRRPRDAVHVRDVAEALVFFATGTRPSGTYNISAGPWGWKNTVRVMQRMLGKEIQCTHAERVKGWLGDSLGAEFVCQRLKEVGIGTHRTIEDGVVEALTSLGWPG